MKKYTHAWLAFMAIKRLQLADILSEQKENAASLVRWFHHYRDFVIEGSWYPDEVFKDMATSHILKYRPSSTPTREILRKLPDTMRLAALEQSTEPFAYDGGNLTDRCESLAHGIVDCFKMLRTEDKGCPISPSNNHIAMRFFILSHYIADCHMPLHCDARPFSYGEDIHGLIEDRWDSQVKKSYKIDADNNRFYYDPDGYPLPGKMTPMISKVEEDIRDRRFCYGWGSGNNSTWDYMKAVSQHSFLLARKMIPEKHEANSLTREAFKMTDVWRNIDEYSCDILCDTIDSIARVWLHIWNRYRNWADGKGHK